MTQDQDQRGPGYVVPDDAVPENETDEYPAEEGRPMTRFQKVASALRGGGHESDELDESGQASRDYWDDTAAGRQAADPSLSRPGDPAAPVAPAPPVAGTGEGVAAMDPDVPVDETNPDVPADEPYPADVPVSQTRTDADHPATEPDMFGTTTRGTGVDPDEPTDPGAPGAATIADAPAGATFATATGAEEPVTPDAVAPDAAVPAEGMGRHAAATPTDRDRELRPGEATGTTALGDFSDLTYGNLIPDAADYTEQWQQIQFKFVDDPHASVTEAADVVAQVTAKMEAAIQERQRAIEERQKAIAEQQRTLRDRWGEGSNADTENLRATLRMYKTFLDQLIGPKA
jgi:hypothetical protein